MSTLKLDPQQTYRLHSVANTRALESSALGALPPQTLMQRAGLAVANLACALAPHARTIWLACGPGNNGGDGLEAAVHLQQRGYAPIVTWLGVPHTLPADAHASWQRAVEAGVQFATEPPAQPDLCVDALLGIGNSRSPQGLMAQWIGHMNSRAASVLAVDVPTGLHADTGVVSDCSVHAHQTLSLLTLKPGLFTGHGRDAAGQVWWDALGTNDPRDKPPTAFLPGAKDVLATVHCHASHKGSRGDIAVIGGASGMVGAAILAASAALHAGAGRVFVSLLSTSPMPLAFGQPELMFRNLDQLALESLTVVCGCGGGTDVRTVLPLILQRAQRLVLDADALNAIAADPSLQTMLSSRASTQPTILTPHPLEAARLLGCDTPTVQADRIWAAQELAKGLRCTVVLKGSGTISTQPYQTPMINPTGNGLLATGGTGDVLAGMMGARLATGANASDAAWMAAYEHGQLADRWPQDTALTAGALAQSLRGGTLG